MALGVALLLWVLVPLAFPGGADDRADAPDGQPGLAAPFSSVDDLPDPEADADGADGQAAADTVDQRLRSGLTQLGGPVSLPGLGGTGGTLGLPPRAVTISVSSSVPLGTVGYIVPTSPDNSYGLRKNVGASFSVSMTAYGDPDYAQVFAQSGPAGAPVTCTITVNGRVTEQRTTAGPYGQLFCQG